MAAKADATKTGYAQARTEHVSAGNGIEYSNSSALPKEVREMSRSRWSLERVLSPLPAPSFLVIFDVD